MKLTSIARLTALALMVSLGSFACATANDAATTASTEASAEMSQPMNSGEVLHVLQTINDGEISQAQLALQRSDTQQVQEAAQMIIQDHRAMNERISQVADETNSSLQATPLSREISMQATQIEQELTDLSGQEFDRAFLERQISLHELALETARDDLMPNASDPQVRDLVSSASDNLQEHLTMAQRNFNEFEYDDSAVGGGPDDQRDKDKKDKKHKEDKEYKQDKEHKEDKDDRYDRND